MAALGLRNLDFFDRIICFERWKLDGQARGWQMRDQRPLRQTVILWGSITVSQQRLG